jgi:hypothetical protein
MTGSSRHVRAAVCAGLLAAVLGGADEPNKGQSQGQAEPGFTPLFDGKSLAGWRVIRGDPKGWGVENGCIVSLGEGHGAWIGTDRPYGDFTLRLEFRLSPESNSGVYLRAPADHSHISRTGLEIQLLDENHTRYKDIKDWQRTGAIYHVAAPKPGHLKPAGEWNRMEIDADGPHVVITLNGARIVDDRLDAHTDPKLVAEHPGLKRTDGLIGLQAHNGRVEFRAIRVKARGKG